MAALYYGNRRIELTAADVQKFIANRTDLSKSSFHSVELDSGVIHFVTGPGVPLFIDERPTSTDDSGTSMERR